MWYVLWTTTGKEENTRQLIYQFIDSSLYSRCAIPYKKKRHFHEGKSEIVKILLFPSYIFIETEKIVDFVSAINKIPGINVILHVGDYYCPIYKEEEFLLTKLMNDNDIIDMSTGYMEGDHVVVLTGPLCGFDGKIKKIIKRRNIAVLEMNLFKQKTEVRLGLELIDKSSVSE